MSDRSAWDSFVEAEGGGFYHYFDWKYVHEAGGRQFIPLMVETPSSHLVGLLSLVREERLLYSTLDSGVAGRGQGLLLKRGLSDDGGYRAISALLEYVDRHCSRRCSHFTLVETASGVGAMSEEPTAALVKCGFRFKYDKETQPPGNYVLELKQPFEEHVWKRWASSMRRAIEKTARSGVVVVHDRDLRYVEHFVQMSDSNFKRHGVRPPSRDEMMAEVSVFRDRTKLYVALRDGGPVVALLCHYTPSTCYLARIGSHEKDTENANKLCWKVAIEEACNAGYRFADFGYAHTGGQTYFKERFRGRRMPLRIYQKRYSIVRTIVAKGPLLMRHAWRDRSYVWRNRRRLFREIVHA